MFSIIFFTTLFRFLKLCYTGCYSVKFELTIFKYRPGICYRKFFQIEYNIDSKFDLNIQSDSKDMTKNSTKIHKHC